MPGVAREPDGVIAIEATCPFRGGYCYGFAALRCTPHSHRGTPYNASKPIYPEGFHYVVS